MMTFPITVYRFIFLLSWIFAICACQLEKTVDSPSGNLLKLHTGELTISVDPSIGGRIASFKYQNIEFLATARDTNNLQWGSTIWPAPQSAWNWPPPVGMDQQPYRVIQADNRQIIIESGPNAYQNLVVKKAIRVLNEKAVELVYTFTNKGDTTIQTGIWENTRIPYTAMASWQTGTLITDNIKGLTQGDSISTLNLIEQSEHAKLFIYSPGGWINYHKDGHIFRKRFPIIPAVEVALEQAPIEIYLDPERGFAELENHGGFVNILPELSTSLRVVWEVL